MASLGSDWESRRGGSNGQNDDPQLHLRAGGGGGRIGARRHTRQLRPDEGEGAVLHRLAGIRRLVELVISDDVVAMQFDRITGVLRKSREHTERGDWITADLLLE